MERLDFKKLQRVKSSIMLRSEIGLQLWETWTLSLIVNVHGKQLERISKFQPKRV
jgi:hypothetical protein